MTKKVCVVGAGLSGLACAVELTRNGFEVDVYERSSKIGGRVQSDDRDGFLLDKGFQVYLPSYEMGQYFFDHEKLDLQSFSAGAQVFSEGLFQDLSDPIREPSSMLSTLMSTLGSFKDKLLILKLKSAAASADQKIISSVPTSSYLGDFGFSQKFINSFFKPFFAGIFLEKDLLTSQSFFLYLFDKFSKSDASVPKAGMGALPKQLAAQLKDKTVFLNSEIVAVDREHVQRADGSKKKYDFVVVATTPEKTNTLLNTNFETSFNSANTYYFKTQSLKRSSKKLYLNSNQVKIVNHVACMSAVSKSYAPEGWVLYSATTVGGQDFDLSTVETDLKLLFGEKEINTWQHLKTYKIKLALPSNPLYSNAVLKKEGVFICGEFTESPSIQGALSSGYQVAKDLSRLL